MMKAGYIIGGLLLIGLSIYIFVFQNTKPTVPIVKEGTSTPIIEVPTGLWVEVTQGTVSSVTEEGVTTTLKTGSPVSAPIHLSTDGTGIAIVHYPDGSEFRLEPKTDVMLRTFSYSQTSSSIVMDASLVSGRVWSKVIGLLTPDSSWKIETPNASAFVHGTAFGTEYASGTTMITGSEHNVTVYLKNKKTDEEYTNASTTVKETQTLEVNDSKVDALIAQLTSASSTLNKKNSAALAKVFVLKNRVLAKKGNDWISQNEMKDSVIEKLKKESHYDPTVGTAGRGIFEDSVKEKLKNEVLNKREGTTTSTVDNVTSHKEDEDSKDSSFREDDNTRASSALSHVSEANDDTKLSITLNGGDASGKEFEPNSLFFVRVFFTQNGGASKDVTSQVDWTFDAQFLTKKVTGAFTTIFPDTLSESGPQKTTIRVSYKDAQSGKTYTTSFVVTVKPQVDDTVPLGMKTKSGQVASAFNAENRAMPTVSNLKKTTSTIVVTPTKMSTEISDVLPSIVR